MQDIFKKFIKKQNHSKIPKIKFKTNFNNCILQAFIKRGFEQTDQQNWDIIWSEKQNIPEIYQKRLQLHQKINHFRNFYQLCRKDLLIKNLKKHKKSLQRQGHLQQAQIFNFYPQTYILPNQYVIFADHFKKHQQNDKNIWIMKPSGRSQGKGIFLFNKLSQVSQWQNHSAENYIVQKYINDPLLIGGKKFDIRIYVLVTSFSPLTVYLYRSGFARFTHTRYDDAKLQNSQIHLTNVAIQKNSEGYDETIGGKWYIDRLKTYLITKFGQKKITSSFLKIQQIIIKTLQSTQKIMASERQNSFQLYGFDILLNQNLEPWLIQVNGSPSMTANTKKDYQMKMSLLDDTLYVINMEKYITGAQEQIGGFDLIFKSAIDSKKNILYNQNSIQKKISFLGSYNNREQNLKKIAKSQSSRLNLQFSNNKEAQNQKLNPINNNLILNKRNIYSRKSTKIGSNLCNKQTTAKGNYRRKQNQSKKQIV